MFRIEMSEDAPSVRLIARVAHRLKTQIGRFGLTPTPCNSDNQARSSPN